MIYLLALLFFVVGILSALIGLGGGTAYLVLMELFRLPVQWIPLIALSSNIIVSSSGAGVRLLRGERCSPRLLVPVLLPAMGLAYLGGSLRLAEQTYRLLLNALVLLILLLRLLLQDTAGKKRRFQQDLQQGLHRQAMPTLVAISAAIGLASGLIGIGGGIILGPVLYLSGLSYQKIPLITAIYILLNSLVAIAARLQNLPPGIGQKLSFFSEWQFYLLPLASLLSSLLAMRFIALRINAKQVKVLVMAVIALLSLYNLVRLLV